MNIQEMHSMFRTLGQQLGMQLIRGILPESIDIFINNVITEKIKTELLSSVHTALQDSTNTQASTMSSINTFRTLYRTARYSIPEISEAAPPPAWLGKLAYYNSNNGYHIINIPTINTKFTLESDEYKINPMLFLGFSVEYENTIRGNAVACRLIGSDVLETTLRDYCNGASKDSPIVVLNSKPIVIEGIESNDTISNEQVDVYTGCKDCRIKYLNIKYIKAPNVVKYDINLDNCINCDLPAYTHFDIVEKAVAKFYTSIGAMNNNNVQQRQ